MVRLRRLRPRTHQHLRIKTAPPASLVQLGSAKRVDTVSSVNEGALIATTGWENYMMAYWYARGTKDSELETPNDFYALVSEVCCKRHVSRRGSSRPGGSREFSL